MNTPANTSSPQKSSRLAVIPEVVDGSMDPVIAHTLREDALFVFFKERWREIVGTALVVGLIVLAVRMVKTNILETKISYSDTWYTVQRAIEDVTTKLDARDQEKDEQKKAALSSEAETLYQTAERRIASLSELATPFDDIAGLYQGTLVGLGRRLGKSGDAIQAFGNDQIKPQLFSELRILAKARALAQSEATYEQALSIANLLIEQGTGTAVPAAGLRIALHRAQGNSANLAEANKEMLHRLEIKFPEQHEQIAALLSSL